MWLVDNQTPYAADGGWVQDRDGNKIWLVVVKATFEVTNDGSTLLAEEQCPAHKVAVPHGELGASSLVYESDFLGVKPGTDVLFNGLAWAPSRRTATAIDVQLTVGPVKKTLRVSGDRRWERGLTGVSMSAPEPFNSLPITFERAYGGWDRSASDPSQHRLELRNPVGTGFACESGACLDTLLPNVEYHDQLISSWKDRPDPAGLGVVDCAWSPRRELAGTYDDDWRRERFPLWASDFDLRYHHSAPADQQVPGYLRGGEAVELLNLSEGGRSAFALPKVYPFFQTRFGRERVEHRGQLCTVTIEPEMRRVVMSWQSSLVCNHRVDELDCTVVSEKQFL